MMIRTKLEWTTPREDLGLTLGLTQRTQCEIPVVTTNVLLKA